MRAEKIRTGLLTGSLTLLITINIFNILNYLFHFATARLLTSTNYGILAALMSILFIFTVPAEAIQTIIARYTSKEPDPGKIKNILKKALRKGLKISFLLFLVYLLIAVPVSMFININYFLMALTGLFIFIVFLLPITRGALQGKKKFNSLGLNMILEAGTKLLLAIFLVLAGFQVYGAMAAVIIGAFLAFGLSFLTLREIFYRKEKPADTRGIYKYSTPVFITVLAVTIFYSLDIILAKAFFPSELAGQYAIASILAKIIFFGTLPISKAMFPISAEAHRNGSKSRGILAKSLIVIGLLITLSLIIISLFPDILIRIFSGSYYPQSAKILFYLAVSMSLISLTNLILLYKLSIDKIKRYNLMFLFLIVEVALLSYFRESLMQYSISLMIANLIFLLGSIFLFNRR